MICGNRENPSLEICGAAQRGWLVEFPPSDGGTMQSYVTRTSRFMRFMLRSRIDPCRTFTGCCSIGFLKSL